MFLIVWWNSGQKNFLRLYPSANILVAKESDFTPAARKIFCSKIATNDYDAVIISYTQFAKIPISESFQQKYIKKQLDELENLSDEAKRNHFGRNGEIRGLEAAKKTSGSAIDAVKKMQSIRITRFILNNWELQNCMLMKLIITRICLSIPKWEIWPD